MPHVFVWDIETVPDLLKGFAAANGHDGSPTTRFELNLARNSPSTSTIRSSAFPPY